MIHEYLGGSHDDERAQGENSVQNSVAALCAGDQKQHEVADVKQLYAKAMAARWCDKKDRKFCELAFYKLYNYDAAKYLRPGEVSFILSLALYDVERGDVALTTVRSYMKKGVMPAELGILTGKVDLDRIIPTVAGLLKAVGEASPELLAAVWQIVASRSRFLPPLETIKDNVIPSAILAEMGKRGYVMKTANTTG